MEGRKGNRKEKGIKPDFMDDFFWKIRHFLLIGRKLSTVTSGVFHKEFSLGLVSISAYWARDSISYLSCPSMSKTWWWGIPWPRIATLLTSSTILWREQWEVLVTLMASKSLFQHPGLDFRYLPTFRGIDSRHRMETFLLWCCSESINLKHSCVPGHQFVCIFLI